MVERAEWLIRKDGYFYRPNCQGYTTHKHEAGRYTKEKAEAEASIEPWHMKAIHEDEWPDDAVSTNYKGKDARIAELAAENKRLKRLNKGLHDEVQFMRKAAKENRDRYEALASTGAVKVKAEPCDHDWFDCSNSVVLPPAKSCRKCGWTVGADEAVGMFVEWPWLSALHPHPRDTNTVDAHETANVSDKPEDQQEPVAWLTNIGWVDNPRYTVSFEGDKTGCENFPVYTRPSEQAVTEVMVEAAWNDWQTGKQEYGPEAIRAALKAAMEAGR